ncbi:MAG: extracellular solute-binding protein [Phycisphaeraceae bacterium]|nr:MAG: extracellular solute-binding protein [Phycisphaeraceae bacterium]
MRHYSLGVWIVVAIAVLSSVGVAVRGGHKAEGLTMWTFARPHAAMYRPIVDAWNENHDPGVDLQLLSLAAVEHRMLAGFYAGVETADLIEVERSIAGRAFTGPLEAVGFTDLTDRMREEGLIDRINPPSFGPWTSRGHIFGIPHDVHPVLLGYRTDLIEAAGIDVTLIETWDDFKRVMRPLIVDADGDGDVDRYPLAYWPTDLDKDELLILQAGGALFDADGRATIDTATNAAILAELVSWCVGPDRIACEAPDFTQSGNDLKRQGYAACYFFPDWMCDVWNKELPELSGKLRLMPLPAWEPGGLRTSVWGGTMLAIPKTAKDFDACWEFAKHLYLSDELARTLYRVGDIITPITEHWDDPVFDEPDPYFGGQAKGRLYIQMAPHIPARSSSPYNRRAIERVSDAGMRLLEYAKSGEVYDPGALQPKALELLHDAQAEVERQMARTAVFREGDSSKTSQDNPGGDG